MINDGLGLSCSSSIKAGGEAVLGADKLCSLNFTIAGEVSLFVNGEIKKSNTTLTLDGSYGVTPLYVSIEIEAKAGPFECTIYKTADEARPKIGSEVSEEFSIVVYTFPT